ncbi:MAG TPA: hypothetical protein DEF47_02610 [Herpetosiphon sp.]|nr:hypothetical protein [Herpetosiphon sp.]
MAFTPKPPLCIKRRCNVIRIGAVAGAFILSQSLDKPNSLGESQKAEVKRQKGKGARGQVAELKAFGYRNVVWYAIHSR